MLRIAVLLLAIFLPLSVARAESVLLMAEEDGCFWCARWTKEIGAIYGKTAEGQAAPLRRYDIHDGTPEGVTLKRTVHYTPTFILITDGKEVGRIEGYPGEDFFWGLLEQVMSQANIPVAPAG